MLIVVILMVVKSALTGACIENFVVYLNDGILLSNKKGQTPGRGDGMDEFQSITLSG